MRQNKFRVTFRGVRGSIPSPVLGEEIEEKIARALEMVRPEDLKDDNTRHAFIDQLPLHIRSCYGGNSSCVQLEVGGEHLIFDCGTGLRVLGNILMKKEFGRGEGEAHLFLSHTHWDHIMGIPFFVPFYVSGNKFKIYAVHPNIKERLIGQQKYEYFPVSFNSFAASVDIVSLEEQKILKIGDATVTWKEMDHPGRSFAFRVDYQGKSFVYATDAEYKQLADEDLQPTIDFFKDADLLVFDSQYTFIEGIEREDWGHSSTFIGVDIATQAGVKQIAFYHHEPTYSDFKLNNVFQQTRKYLKAINENGSLKMFLSYEGLSMDLLKC